MLGLIAILLAHYVVLQASAALLPPSSPKLTSENFKHILTWEDPNNESPIYYHVTCSFQMHEYETVKDCANITTRHCDLTKYFTNTSYNYRVRVSSFTDHSSSKPSIAVSLTPKQHTILGPPRVDIAALYRGINVTIQPPVSHLWNKEKQQYVSMLHTYPLLEYTIQLMRVTEKLEYFVIHSSQVRSDAENNTFNQSSLPNGNYCVSVSVSAAENIKPTVSSEPKCVVTEYHVTESSIVLILSAVCGVLLFILLVLCLFGLDYAGYICRAKTLIPKVLKSIPTSENMESRSEFSSPTFSVNVDIIISEKFVVEQKPQSEDKNCEGGYASRKRLQESDTSGTTTSGEFPSAVSSSMGSSGEANSSAEEDLSVGHRGDGMAFAVSELGGSSIAHRPVSTTEDSSNLPFDTSGVFNINLNTVSIRNPSEVWTGFKPLEVPQEEAEDSMESHETGIALDQHSDICLGVDDLEEEEYCSDYEEEEDISENHDSDSNLISGYMRR